MTDSKSLREIFDAANEFLRPVLKRGTHSDEIRNARGNSLVEILGRHLSPQVQEEDSLRSLVIEKALLILTDIHLGFATSVENEESFLSADPQTQDAALEDAKRRQGIYPSLSQGVGVPLEKRVISSLPTGVIAKQASVSATNKLQNESLLHRIITPLVDILFDERPGIQPLVRGRILSDILCGSADLAFNSQSLTQEKKDSRSAISYAKNDGRTSTSVLLPMLSAFLRPDAASWFKSVISTRISQIPLRDDGVVQTIFFLASQFAPSLGQDSQEPSSQGPPITVQAIMQTSKLLSSVPQGMDPAAYFHNIAPKLLALLDGNDPDLKRTAAYVVGSGILGKKQYGAPGGIGHSIFVEPLFKAVTAELDDSSRRWLRSFAPPAGDVSPRDTEDISQGDIMVDEPELSLAIERLATLSLQHPNPGLVKRLVHPILLPLWGLACYTQEKNKKAWHEKVFSIIQTYFSLSAGLQPLKKIVDNLLWNGGPTWTYRPGRNGGISLHKRSDSSFNVVQLVESLDSRAENFSKLLGSDPQSEERTGDIFLYVSQKWLITPSRKQPALNEIKIMRDEEAESEFMTQKLVSAKIAEKLLDDFKDTLSRHPLRVLELVQQLIESELIVAEERERRRRARRSGKASLESLANIVSREEDGSATEGDQAESAESLSATFSLLSTILASPDFSMSKALLPILEKIKSQLDQLLPSLPPSLSTPGNTSSMLLELHISFPEGQKDSKQAPSAQASDLETHRQALKNISSSLPPVQAEGLSLLSNLIAKSSPVLDIPSTLSLLLSIVTEQSSESAAKEEFVYLNAIKLIGNLASKHPRTVVKTLVERYADKNEERTLDQRLKVGEALLRTIQDLGEALVGETAQIIGEGMIAVAGRRGRKPEAHKARKRQLEKERREKEREEREVAMPPGWKISSPALSKPEEKQTYPEDDDSETETPEQAEYSAKILAAWAAGSAADLEPDDLRVRASAISILATAIQTNLLALGPSIASSAVDLALSTLTHEPGPESAILRRASVVLLLDLLKAMDSARENRKNGNLGFGFSLADNKDGTDVSGSRGPATIGNIPTMLRSLAFVESRETDGVVRGHIRVLIESLEAWMEKSLLWGIGVHSQDNNINNEPRLELGDRIAGLDIDPLAGRDGDRRAKPRIEEIE
ncbi:Protein required for cell viability [Rasamsonia emersonii CBS 393.64]|uniref:Protein required for cell viability n=1 Tax=Rasamsonia emersonii (strain ATCC 16479 / CBS 393.64 / IMI 116815) TaxID=1408163 RepID=A0A0F4Z137_RASE3|nr:Protein required for cell viability [Rasamsonia emersonii CBS 393.64]KKA24085.1 Protein required for cell viability [Rasamsonia emersonii CBS 393.64]